jgi:hypothetical protein
VYFVGLLGERYGTVPDCVPGELLDKEPWLLSYPSASMRHSRHGHGAVGSDVPRVQTSGHDGCVTIESFDPNMESIAKLCCIWRKLADSPEQLASGGLKFLRGVYERECLN